MKKNNKSPKPLLLSSRTAGPDLSRCELFKCFSPSELKWIQKHCELQTFKRRETLFQEGAPLSSVYFILKGHVKFCKKTSLDEDITFGLFSEGYVFELMTSDLDKNHSFSAYAMSETTILKISPTHFRTHFMGNTDFANRLLYQKIYTIKRIFISRLAAGESVEVRMAHLVWDLLQRPGMAKYEGKTVRLEIPLTRRDFAEIVNTSVETSIRVMRKWVKQGLVTITRRQLIIKDIVVFKKIVCKIPRFT
jgi:CRP/FNR family transcriptional regulator